MRNTQPPCIRCGHKFRDHIEGRCPSGIPQGSDNRTPMFVFGSFLVVAALIVAAAIHKDSPEERAEREQHTAVTNAEFACRNAVKERLRAPSSASFQSLAIGRWSVREIGSGSYAVSSFVDAQNGFGAQIRTTFTCIVSHPGAANESVTVELAE